MILVFFNANASCKRWLKCWWVWTPGTKNERPEHFLDAYGSWQETMSYHFCFLKEHDAQKSKLFYYVKVMWTLDHVPFWMFLFQFSVGILSVPSVNFKVTLYINKTRNMKRAKQKNLKAKKQWENERKLGGCCLTVRIIDDFLSI